MFLYPLIIQKMGPTTIRTRRVVDRRHGTTLARAFLCPLSRGTRNRQHSRTTPSSPRTCRCSSDRVQAPVASIQTVSSVRKHTRSGQVSWSMLRPLDCITPICSMHVNFGPIPARIPACLTMCHPMAHIAMVMTPCSSLEAASTMTQPWPIQKCLPTRQPGAMTKHPVIPRLSFHPTARSRPNLLGHSHILFSISLHSRPLSSHIRSPFLPPRSSRAKRTVA